jgi:4-aminobutyrate aminotransferase
MQIRVYVGMHQAVYPYCLHCKCKPLEKNACCELPITSIEELFKESTAISDTAAIIIEPILGEGGYVVPPKGFMQRLRDLCDANGILLIVDEVQSGMVVTSN